MTEEQRIFDLINDFYSEDEQRIQESQSILMSFVNKIEYLEFFISILSKYVDSNHHLYISFIIIKDSLLSKGSLLETEYLSNTMGNIYNFVISNQSIFVREQHLLNIASESIALLYRLFFANNFLELPNFEDLFSNSESEILLINLKIMEYVLNYMKTSLKHEAAYISHSVQKSFSNYLMSRYFAHAVDVIQSSFCHLYNVAIDIMVLCLSFNMKGDIDTYSFSMSQGWLVFFSNLLIPHELYSIISQSNHEIYEKTIVLIQLYSSSSPKMWNNKGHREFIIDFVDNIISIISFSIENNKEMLELSKLMFRISGSFDLNLIISHPNASFLFENAEKMFIKSFNPEEPMACVYCLRFWGGISLYLKQRMKTDPPELLEMIYGIFEKYIVLFMNFVPEGNEIIHSSFYGYFSEIIDDHKYLWDIGFINMSRSVEYICQLVLLVFEESVGTPEMFYRLSIILLFFASAMNNQNYRIMNSAHESAILYVKMCKSIFYILERSEEIISDNLCFDNVSTLFFEQTIIAFSKSFRTVFTSKDGHFGSIFSYLKNDYTLQQVYDLFMNRFLKNLVRFHDYPEFLYDTLVVIDYMSNPLQNRSLSPLASNNTLLSDLINRNYFLEFSLKDYSKLAKLLVFLNKIYSRVILNKEHLDVFLSYYDEKIEFLAQNGFTDSSQCYILFRELSGFLKGNIDHNLYVVKWVLSKHTNMIIECINIHQQSIPVIQTICKFLSLLAPNKTKPYSFPSDSAEGIELFWLTHKALNGVNKCLLDFPWSIIMIVFPVFSSKYANFGVMQFFGDMSYTHFLDCVFDAIYSWMFEDLSGKSKYLIHLFSIFNGIVELFPDRFINSTPLRNKYIYFVIKSLLSNYFELWPVIGDSLQLVISKLNQNHESLDEFYSVLIVLIDGIMNINELKLESISKAIRLVCIWAPNLVTNIIHPIVSSFESKFREKVEKILDELFNGCTNNDIPLEKTFDKFRESIRPYSVLLSDLPEFRQYFSQIFSDS